MRVGGGIRLFGKGNSNFLGNPHIYQLNIGFYMSGWTISPDGEEKKRAAPGILVEAPFVLWGNHLLQPWMEFGATSSMETRRFGAGLQYYFLIRPWYLKIGVGFGYETFLKYKGTDSFRFSIFRSALNFYLFI